MAEPSWHPAPAASVAVIGLACRFPDADDPPTLLDTILTGRRAFRRLPPCRLDLADYYNADPATSDATYSARAGLIEGWQFDREAFRIPAPAYAAADPAHWLALETAARAMAAAGFPGGAGLDRDRIGVIIGNTLAGDTSRANALRLRWPYVRRVLAESLSAGDVRSDRARNVLRHAAARYLAPFPRAGEYTLAGSTPASIPAGISSYFGFRGGSHAVDSASASSLQAVASACAALTATDIDVAIAGGVDVSLDPLELIGLAKTGAVATGDVRIYDENPTGYLPGEGCGVVVLMRTAQARAAGLPVYAEIVGWGASAGGAPGVVASDASSQLLALRRAYERAGVDPCEVQFIEGHGSGTAAGDEAELTALAELRADARDVAALGSIKANIGHAKAAAGAAGLIKTVLALGTGVIPPTTGVVHPHPLLRGGDAAFWLPEVAEEWPSGSRLAGVSAMGVDGVNVHLVLRSAPGRGSRYDRMLRVLPRLARAGSGKERAACTDRRPDESSRPAAYLLHAPDRRELTAALARVAGMARWLSDAEMVDLAGQLGRDARIQGVVRVAIVATHQAELARLAGETIALLPGLSGGMISTRPGIFAADNADGRVTLLLSDEAGASAGPRARPAVVGSIGSRPPGARAGGARSVPRDAVSSDEAISRSLATLRWLESLDVNATAAVGHGLGEIAGLAWAGVLSEADVAEIGALRAEFLSGPAVRVLAPAGRHAGGRHDAQAVAPDALSLLRAATAQFRFGPPRRRLISTMTGRELASADEVVDLICGGFAGDGRLAEAVTAGAQGATLLVETGPGALLASTAANVCRVPTVGAGESAAGRVWAAAALFAAGAIGQVQPLFAGQPARAIDIWREQVFITNPCQTAPEPRLDQASQERPSVPPARAPGHGQRTGSTAWRAVPPPSPRQHVASPGGWRTERTATSWASTSHTGTGRASDSRASDSRKDAGGSGASHVSTTSLSAGGPGPGTGRTRAGDAEGSGPARVADTATPIAVAAGSVDGLGSWVRCFTKEPGPAAAVPRPSDDGPWRIHVAGSYPFRTQVGPVFSDDPAAGRSLAVIGDPAAPGAMQTALTAAQDASTTGQLVAITTGPGLTGFLASLHAERPSLGVTEVRVPPTVDGLRAAGQYAHAEPGQFRELLIAADGTVREPVLAARQVPGGGQFPLGARDVAMVSRSSGGAALALAHVLACCGTAVVVVGQAGPDEDSAVVAGLEELRLAGARIAYEVVDVADPADLALAVQRIERRLGPVTAVAHAVGPGAPVPVGELTQQALDTHVAAERNALRALLRPVNARRLQLILTFGSVAGRYGLARQGLLAAASSALARQGEVLAAGIPGCHALHIDLPGWSGRGLGGRPALGQSMAESGTAPIGIAEASRLLLKMLATPDLPSRTAVHGRVGVAAPRLAAAPRDGARDAGLTGRFLQDVLVHYPGIELVCDARLSLATDPYLADYRVDGLPVLPPVMALEALAQAAAALAGRPLRQATAVKVDAPVVLPAGSSDGQTRIRICALAEGSKIITALRCEESGFGVDHLRAEFGWDDTQPAADPAADPAVASGPVVAGPAVAQVALPGATGIVDGSELYGPVCFQSGRFRRIATLPEVTSRSSRALARGTDDRDWFSSGQPDPAVLAEGGAVSALLLGSPGLNDASLQALQACVPHRRVWLAGCDSVSFSGRPADGAVEIRAVATGDPVPAPEQSLGGPAAAPPPHQAWDVEAVDSAGQALVTWHGVRLRQAGMLARHAPWPTSLLSVHLERGAIALGLDPDLRVIVRRGQSVAGASAAGHAATPAAAGTGQPATSRWPDTSGSPEISGWPETSGWPDSSGWPDRSSPASGTGELELDSAIPRQRSGRSTTPPTASVPPQPAGPEECAIATGTGQLAGFTLETRGAGFAACGWAVADLRHPVWPSADGLATFSALGSRLSEPPVASAARLEAVAGCLAMARVPHGAPVTFERATADGWAVLGAAGTHVACVVVEISGVPCPVAVAVMTGSPRRDTRHEGDRWAARGGSRGVVGRH